MKTLCISKNGRQATVNNEPIKVECDLIANVVGMNVTDSFLLGCLKKDERNNVKFLSNAKMHEFLKITSNAFLHALESDEIRSDELSLIRVENKQYTVSLEEIVLFDIVDLIDSDNERIGYYDPSDECNYFIFSEGYKLKGRESDLESFIQLTNYAWVDILHLLIQNGVEFDILN